MGLCLQPDLLPCKQSFQSRHLSPVPPLFSLPLAPKHPLKPFANCFVVALGANTRFRRVPPQLAARRGLLGRGSPARLASLRNTLAGLKTILILRSKTVAGRRERCVQERARCASLLVNELQQLQALSSRRTLCPQPSQRRGGAVRGNRERCAARASGCSEAGRTAADPAEEDKAAALTQAMFKRCCGWV